MRRIFSALVALAAVASAACRIYDVGVYGNVNSTVPGDQFHGISQSWVCTSDSLLWAEFFVGAANSGGQYDFDIREPRGVIALYTGHAHAGDSVHYQYARAELTPNPSAAPLVKGKEYVLKVTHSNDDPINFYYNPWDPYGYGEMTVPDTGFHPPPGSYTPDLCARIEGMNRAVSRELAEKPVSQTDLSVDSVWVTQGADAQVTLRARVRNIGNKQFVAPRSAKGSCLRFCIDGERVNAVAEPATLKVGGVTTVQSVPVSPNRSIVHLVSAEANANKEVIEPNFDNNARYCPLSAQ
jgi:hypothetical protein